MNWISIKKHPHPEIDEVTGQSEDVIIWSKKYNNWLIGSYVETPMMGEKVGWYDEFGNRDETVTYWMEIKRPKKGKK